MDRQVFICEVSGHRESLYRIAKTILGSDAECEDAVSEAVLKAYNKLYLLREDRFFKTWLTRIVINTCRSMQKKGSSLPLSTEALEATPDGTESYRDLYEALFSLPEKLKVSVVLHYIEGYSVQEVAGILRVPQGTVKSRLYHGRQLLRLSLGEDA